MQNWQRGFTVQVFLLQVFEHVSTLPKLGICVRCCTNTWHFTDIVATLWPFTQKNSTSATALNPAEYLVLHLLSSI